MAAVTSAISQPVSAVPQVKGLPLIGNALQFPRDRLGPQDSAAKVGPIARSQMAHLPVYIVSDADIAQDVLLTRASSFVKSRVLQFLRPMLGDGLLLAEGETHKRN